MGRPAAMPRSGTALSANMSTRTRRDFLKIAMAAAAASRATNSSPALAAGPAGTGGIDVRVTTGVKRYAAAERLRWSPAPSGADVSCITIDGGKTLQPVLGFGAAFTDAACFMFSQMPEPEREALLEDLFDPKEMGLSVCRTCVGSSDYARSLYSYDEGEPDPELKRFSIDHDKAYILPTIRRAREINPGLFLLASPWSPPGWMKD